MGKNNLSLSEGSKRFAIIITTATLINAALSIAVLVILLLRGSPQTFDSTPLGQTGLSIRRTQQTNDVNLVASAITVYRTNNRGQAPKDISCNLSDLISADTGFCSYISNLSNATDFVSVQDYSKAVTAAKSTTIFVSVGSICPTETTVVDIVALQKAPNRNQVAVFARLENSDTIFCVDS